MIDFYPIRVEQMVGQSDFRNWGYKIRVVVLEAHTNLTAFVVQSCDPYISMNIRRMLHDIVSSVKSKESNKRIAEVS